MVGQISSADGLQSLSPFACDRCQKTKQKCSRERPKCARCQSWPGDCIYSSKMSGRAKKPIESKKGCNTMQSTATQPNTVPPSILLSSLLAQRTTPQIDLLSETIMALHTHYSFPKIKRVMEVLFGFTISYDAYEEKIAQWGCKMRETDAKYSGKYTCSLCTKTFKNPNIDTLKLHVSICHYLKTKELLSINYAEEGAIITAICPICNAPFLFNAIEQHIFITHTDPLPDFHTMLETLDLDQYNTCTQRSLTEIDFINMQSLRSKAISWDQISKSYPYKTTSICSSYHQWRKSKNLKCSGYITFHNLGILGNKLVKVWDTNAEFGTVLHVDTSGTNATIPTTTTNNGADAGVGIQKPWHIYTTENVLLHNQDVWTETTTPDDIGNFGKGLTSLDQNHTSNIHTLLNPL